MPGADPGMKRAFMAAEAAAAGRRIVPRAGEKGGCYQQIPYWQIAISYGTNWGPVGQRWSTGPKTCGWAGSWR